MPTLNDLKNNNFTPSITESSVGFTPTIQDNQPDDSIYAGKGSVYDTKSAPVSRPVPEHLSQNISSTEKKIPSKVSLSTGKPITKSIPTNDGKPKLVKADLSQLPKNNPNELVQHDEQTERDREKEIFRPGGDFDRFMERKRKEKFDFDRRMAEQAELSGKPLVNPDGSPVPQEEIDVLLGERGTKNVMDEVDIMGALDEFDTQTETKNTQRRREPVEQPTVTIHRQNRRGAVTQPVENEQMEKDFNNIPKEYTRQPAPVDENDSANEDIPFLDESAINNKPAEEDFDPENEPQQVTYDNAPEESFDDLDDMLETEEKSVKSITEEEEPEIESSTAEEKSVPAPDNLELEHGFIQENQVVTDGADDEEIKEDAEVTNAAPTDEERREILKNLVKEKIKPAVKKINLSGYSIAKHGTTTSINFNTMKHISVVKWPLINTGICVKMKEFSGQDIERIRYSLNNNQIRPVLQSIYDHIVSAKPKTFEDWMKSIVFDDYDHLFFAVYCASFVDANYIPIDCQNKACQQKTYVTDHVPFMHMVKFADDKARKEFIQLYKEDATETKGLYPAQIIPISDQYAIGFIQPSLYSTITLSEYLDDDFTAKYNNTVAYLPYIDTIYQIDQSTQTLVPIEWKKYENNDGKTVKSRVIRYEHIFNTMTIDEIAAIDGCVQKLNEKASRVTYVIPETTCPYCKHVNPEQPQNPATLLFLRSQLGRLATS